MLWLRHPASVNLKTSRHSNMATSSATSPYDRHLAVIAVADSNVTAIFGSD
jgi:hypothetical protein